MASSSIVSAVETGLSEASTVVDQVTKAVSSISTPVSAVAGAVEAVATDIQPLINPSVLQRANQLKEGAQTDATNFKNLLLIPDWDGAGLMLDGLPSGIGLGVSEAERSRLVATERNATAWDILGWYCVGRNAQLLANLDQLQALSAEKTP